MQKIVSLAIIGALLLVRLPQGDDSPLSQADAVINAIIYGSSVASDEIVEPSKQSVERLMIEDGRMGLDDMPNTAVSVVDAQDDFLASYGHYWQGLSPVGDIPAAGEPLPVDPTVHPVDLEASWATLGISLPEEMDVSVTVNSYYGPDGAGYTVVGDVFVGGDHWRRTTNFGPESWRATDWITITDWITP